MSIKASEIAWREEKARATVTERKFEVLGDQHYRLTLNPAGIVIDADRVRRHSHELWGEVTVSVNGTLPEAKKVYGDILHAGDLNFSSVQSRGGRAKIFANRSGADFLDWEGFVEELTYRIQNAERTGKPAKVLADEEEGVESEQVFEVAGWPILGDLPMVLFGDSSSGKSYFAMYVAGELAKSGVPVLYADWEFSMQQHRQRLGRLFQPMPKNLFYVRCERPLVNEIDRLNRLILEHHCGYVVCDSISFACGGAPESAEVAGEYFRAIRQMRVGSLHIAHIPKQYDDGREAQIFGSTFFKAGARSVWFIERTQNNPRGEVSFGLYHRKNNLGDLLAPRGYKLLFRDKRTLVESVNVQESDELASKLPLLDRMLRCLKTGAMTAKSLSEECNCSAAAIRATLSRHKSKFIRIGNKIGATTNGLDF